MRTVPASVLRRLEADEALTRIGQRQGEEAAALQQEKNHLAALEAHDKDLRAKIAARAVQLAERDAARRRDDAARAAARAALPPPGHLDTAERDYDARAAARAEYEAQYQNAFAASTRETEAAFAQTRTGIRTSDAALAEAQVEYVAKLMEDEEIAMLVNQDEAKLLLMLKEEPIFKRSGR